MTEEKKPKTQDRETELAKSRKEWQDGRKERLAKKNSEAKAAHEAAKAEMKRLKKERM